MIRTKEELEKSEKMRLAEYAVKSSESKGRKHKEQGGSVRVGGSVGGGGRLCFQKDRDRIIHCKSFRRLDEKTQVFPAFFGDHYRTRLTHTLEVAQIARDICRRLGLNEDLAEAIALAHDLGHPPFGHSGEEALDEILSGAGGAGGAGAGAGSVAGAGAHFEHNEQSRRVVEKLEKLYPEFDGLNLSLEVLEGLEKHKTSWDRPGEEVGAMHLEGQVVNLADEIAYTNHDMDDGLRSGILKVSDLEKAELWKEAESGVSERYGVIAEGGVKIARVISQIIYLMISDICDGFDGKVVEFSAGMAEEIKELREILFDKFYLSSEVKGKLEKGKEMIKKLFKYYLENPEKVPARYRDVEKLEIAVKDYVAGMTDQFLTREIEKIS
jgi:dGTPase